MLKKTGIKIKLLTLLFVVTHSFNLSAEVMVPSLGSNDCESLLLVSSWRTNNVKIFDGCSGEYVRDLDSQNLIEGPLGILEAPNGDILVISETNGRLLRFDRETLSQGSVVMGDDPATPAVENNFISAPSGAVIDEDGFMYASSFALNSVVKIDTQSWQIVDETLATNNGLINGIDAGIAIDDDYLYLPGYYSDNILKVDLETKAVSELVAPGAGGLNAARTILIRDEKLLVTSERSHSVLQFDRESGLFEKIVTQVVRPTGMVDDGSGENFLLNNSGSVFRASYSTDFIERVVERGAGGLHTGTFIYRLQKSELDDDDREQD